VCSVVKRILQTIEGRKMSTTFERYKELVLESDFADEFISAWSAASTKLESETGYGLGIQLGWAAFSTVALVKAWRAAKRGDYTKAIYHTLMWHGMNRNTDAMVAGKQRLMRKQSPLNGYFQK
jgi:hypothetical protein